MWERFPELLSTRLPQDFSIDFSAPFPTNFPVEGGGLLDAYVKRKKLFSAKNNQNCFRRGGST